MSRVIVIGANGQDGQLLGELLRGRGDEVVGVARERCTWPDGTTSDHHVRTAAAAHELFARARPAALYYLAACHGAAGSTVMTQETAYWEESLATHVHGWVHCLDAARAQPAPVRLFYAASSRLFGQPARAPQDETTPLAPRCVYGVTKAAGVLAARLYRERYGLHASVGFLYNHESPRRGPAFLSRQVVDGLRLVRRGAQAHLVLRDLSARADWGYAPDFVEAMRRIVALDTADDYVIATGESHTVAEFAATACASLGLEPAAVVRSEAPSAPVTPDAPAPVPLVGDASRLRARTGWRPSVTFAEMVARLVAER